MRLAYLLTACSLERWWDESSVRQVGLLPRACDRAATLVQDGLAGRDEALRIPLLLLRFRFLS